MKNIFKLFLKVAVAAFIFTVSLPSYSATVVEFYHAKLDHYFITADTTEAAFLDSKPTWGWTRTGNSFETGSGTSPVCRFYGVFNNGTVGSHFYTADPTECAFVKGNVDWGWASEGNAFNIAVPVNGSCPNNGTPVYRAYNDGKGGAANHRITTSLTAIQEVVARGWINEGVVMCAPRITASTCNTAVYASPYFPVGDYSISNNTWGKGDIPDTAFHQCISGGAIMTNGVQTGISTYVEWDWPTYTSGPNWWTVKAYPEIIYSPNGRRMESIQLSNIGNLTVAHDVTPHATGNFDLIYDIWMDSTSSPNWPHDFEFVIALQSSWDMGPDMDIVILDGHEYIFSLNTITIGVDTWKQLVFYSKYPLLKASIPLKSFIDYLIARGILTQSTYISTIEFGSEVVDGSGGVTINSYSVTR